MKKLLFVLGTVLLLAGCDNDSMDNNNENNNKPKYYTVTYHSEGHTSGEVPVDEYRYPVKRPDLATINLPSGYMPKNGFGTVLTPSALRKAGEYFQGWLWPLPENLLRPQDKDFPFVRYRPGERVLVDNNINLYAEWGPYRYNWPDYDENGNLSSN